MKSKNIFFVIGIIVFASFAIYGIEHVDEWIGIQKYWNPFSHHSTIFKCCKNNKNSQNCAVINAYLLLTAREKENAEWRVQRNTADLHAIEQDINSNVDSDFFKKRRLQERKERFIRIKERSEDQLQRIMEELKMGNLSENLQDNDVQKKLEYAFNTLVSSAVDFELDCLQEALKYAQQGIRNRG